MHEAVNRKQLYDNHLPSKPLTPLAGWQEGHPACKKWVVRYWRCYLSGAWCKWFAYGPADDYHPIISWSSKIENGLPF